ncbi:endolytic transglycosylase MltG [Rhodococcus sp. SGAir0479]|uniref:endolytic transglycosylase MltG n=1 Tax=Rhodococcus sp. SGAir0479 TaxID=2567884 RepID=UPI0010CCC37C|nr:endolytic transglycosylase MltG [Rhodococcus sp. SGAir0479]QCQ90919.1 endolytic transglycosylase MltG [Rhodococcus sp. SGAir0479]
MSDRRDPTGRPEYESAPGYAGEHDYGHDYGRPYEPAPGHDDGYGRPQYGGPDHGAGYGYEPEYDAYAYDDSRRRALPTAVGARPVSRGEARRLQAAARRKRRGRVIGVLAGAVLLGGMGAAAFAVYDKVTGRDIADYAGPGGPEVVVQVHPGDTADQIADAMAAKDVVKSSAAFYRAALHDDAMGSVQPGYYSVATRISGSDAVSALVSPEARVGALVVSEGRQLHDTKDVQTGAVKKGIYSLIAEASCVGRGDAEKCISYDDLNRAGAGADLAALGVPDWARAQVANVPDRDRQLEGLIAAGSWDFDPTQSPVEILRHLVGSSADSYESTGLESAGGKVGLAPYQMLVVASLVEREALPTDFDKVARVVLNRLAVNQPLQFDSTVNYALDETEVATTDADRARVTPWNTYAMPGLPATPIASPSINALRAVEDPAPGDFLYFVTIDKKGTTLFTRSYEEHLANIELARRSGILDSGR